MANNNPYLLYIQTRDDLLQYEDARINSLLQAVANFYTQRNDQSIWGNFLRALAIELAKIDYGYSYDIVSKNPSYLTPTDIRRRWADPLYVSSNWPSRGQFDTAFKLMLVELIAAYRKGTTVKAIQAVIFAYTGINIVVEELYKEIGNGVYDQSDRNAIRVSVSVGNAGTNPLTTITTLTQLQTIIQSLYNAIDLAKPAHVGLEFATVFGEGEQLDCLLSPTYLTDEMLLSLSPAQQAYYVQSGYTLINPVVFWMPSTATSNPYDVNTVLRDSNGNLQLAVSSYPDGNGGYNAGYPGTWVPPAHPAWSATPSGRITDGTSSTPIIWENISSGSPPLTLATQITAAEYEALPSVGSPAFSFQALYQKQYTNYCCPDCESVPQGINDMLRIFIRQSENPPLDNMLIQGPVLDPKNPTTTVAAFGKKLCPLLTPTQWAQLPSIFVNIVNAVADGANATYTYTPSNFGGSIQFLHEGELLTITGFAPGSPFNVTAKIHNVINTAAYVTATSVSGGILTVTTVSNTFAPGMLVNLAGTNEPSLNGHAFTVLTANPTGFTASVGIGNYAKTAEPFPTASAEVTSFQITSAQSPTSAMPIAMANAGLVTPTLQSGYYLSGGNYVLGAAVMNLAGVGGGESWNPGVSIFQGQFIVDLNGYTQLALNAGTTGSIPPTYGSPAVPWGNKNINEQITDNTVKWRNVGKGTFTDPAKWVGILNLNYLDVGPDCTEGFTGEIGNWNSVYPYGLLAPRLSQCWEISGDQDFIWELN